MYDIHIIERWIKEGEGSRLDFKSTINSRPKIARNLVAFANSRGGRLVVGVEDKGFLSGIDYEGEKYELEKTAALFCSPNLDLHFSKLQHQGRVALVAEVRESPKKPHFAIDKNGKKKLYVRLADSCVVPPPAIAAMLENGEMNGLQRTYDYQLAERRLVEFLRLKTGVSVSEWAVHRSISVENARRFLVDICFAGSIRLKDSRKELVFGL